MAEGIKVLSSECTGEIIEKKSRFIATFRPVSSIEEATAFIEEMKKQYWDARHNCSAFVIGDNNEISRCSDDGEPSGTAGRPMLEVLIGEDIHNVAVVVTRYFGGVLLGIGGLVRAYQGAVKEGLSNAKTHTIQKGVVYTVTCDYNGIGKLQYILGNKGIIPISTEYGTDVKAVLALENTIIEGFKKEIIEALNGNVDMEKGDEIYFAVMDGKTVLI